MHRPSPDEAAKFSMAAIALAIAIWPLAFNLGAHQTVHIDHLFQVWAASIAALIAGITIGRTDDGKRHLSLHGAALLLLPTVWIITEIVLFSSVGSGVGTIKTVLATLTVTVALPYIIWVIFSAVLPEARELQNRRLKLGLGAVAIIIATAAWLVGTFNYLVATCEDFEAMGASPPQNCWPAANFKG